MNIGERIKQTRKRVGITQKELGERLMISQVRIAQYETGKRQPKIETLEKIAAALNVNVWDLYDGYTPRNDNNYFWTSYLSDKLQQINCRIIYDAEDAGLWIEFPDGALEVTEAQLKELDETTIDYLNFKLNELKKKHPENLRERKKTGPKTGPSET